MTYPPGSPGYPPAQQPTTQFAAPTQQFGKAPDASPGVAGGPSKLPMYLSIAIAVLGLAAYAVSYGPIFTIDLSGALGELPGLPQEGFSLPNQTLTGGAVFSSGGGLSLVALLLGALIAGVGVLPRQKPRHGLVAVLSVFGFLTILLQMIGSGSGTSAGWALITIVVLAFLQAAAAVANLLLDAGVIAAPAPKPRYEQQYGQYGAPYYGPPGHGGRPQQGPAQQRAGYPSPYGGYPGGGPSTGGFAGGQQGGPPTPPTGFPTYGQPPSNSAPTAQVPAQPQSSSSSTQSGPAPS
jgi:hypothetical protein